MDATTARHRLASAPVAHLATVTPAGDAHIVPCCFALSDDCVYSVVDGKPKTTIALRRIENLMSNPRASLLVDHYEDDWSQLWWVRVDSRGRIADSTAERDRAIDVLVSKYEQYRTATSFGPVIALDIDHWSWWSSSPVDR